MTRKQSKTTIAKLKELLTQDKDFLRPMLAELDTHSCFGVID